MKAITRVRYAAHLMAYIEELHDLRQFTTQELHVIQDALLLLIRQEQHASANKQMTFPLEMLLSASTKTYEFQQWNNAPNRIIVYEDGQPERRLKHVPIFAYGFGLAGLPSLDSALAVLADYFGETLSLREFAAGKGLYCHVYQPFAREFLTRSRFKGRFEAKRIEVFLHRQYSKKEESGKCEVVGLENSVKKRPSPQPFYGEEAQNLSRGKGN